MLMHDKPVNLELDQPSARTANDCPVEDWLSFLGHRWNALLLWHLLESPKRHSEFLSLLSGISSKVLTDRLTTLEQRGLIIKIPLATFPRTVNYALTNRGIEITTILNQIEIWTKLNTTI